MEQRETAQQRLETWKRDNQEGPCLVPQTLSQADVLMLGEAGIRWDAAVVLRSLDPLGKLSKAG